MLDSASARRLLTARIRSVSNAAFINEFSEVFILLSPDIVSLLELEKIYATSSGPKKEALSSLIEKLQSNLEYSRIFSAGNISNSLMQKIGLQKNLDDLLLRVQRIRLSAENLSIADQIRPFFPYLLGCFILFALLVAANSLFYSPAASRKPTRTNFKPLIVKVPQKPELPGIGTILKLTLLKYEPYNFLWQAQSADGKLFKVSFEGASELKAGDQIALEIQEERASVTGSPIVKGKRLKMPRDSQ
jgi:hypothetical protein